MLFLLVSLTAHYSHFHSSRLKLKMEKLNEYLQALLSTCSYELHLEPNKTPYVISDKGTTDVANTPILGTQISMMIFPLIPPAVKQELPNKPEIEFVHNHTLGNFNFQVKKSSAGFNVTIRPMLSGDDKESIALIDEGIEVLNDYDSSVTNDAPAFKPSYKSLPTLVSSFSNTTEPENIRPETDPQSFSYEETPAITNREETETSQSFDDPADYQIESFEAEIEVVPANEPKFTDSFSEVSEPAQNLQEFSDEMVIPNVETSLEPQITPQPAAAPQTFQQNQPVEQHYSAPQPQTFAPVSGSENSPARKRMDALFYKMSEVGASDLHLSVSMPPLVRKDGKMQALESAEPTLTPESLKELLTSIMPAKNQEEFARRHDTDFAYEIENLARFRANIFMDRKGMGGVFRIIPTKILTAEQLGLSKAIMDLCNLSKGLVVVTGPTGSGKSTTLCAMIDSINKSREDHIITIEDPIEFTHENQKCLVNQREVHNHTDSFKDALRAALREDPDILLVGEMRDLETIAIAIETAETGHLVFGTLHTTTAASTIDRIIDQFPADRQQQIRVMLSESLKGVIAQTLLPKKGGGRVAALEVLIVTPAISNLIREGKTFQIPSAMQTGKAQGMVMLNDALFDLVKKGLVDPRDAYIKAVDKANFEALLTRNGLKI